MADAKPTFRFDDAGTIPPPGWIGRAARALFGYGSLYWVYQIVRFGDVGALTNLSVIGFTLFALQLIPYTVNIGFGIRLSFWPRLLAALGIAAAAYLGWQSTGEVAPPSLWNAIAILNIYVYGHLGISFVLAAIFATAGCEMRALPILIGRLAGRRARDHYCPGPIRTIDHWERKQFGQKP